jgi:hypothetical protein
MAGVIEVSPQEDGKGHCDCREDSSQGVGGDAAEEGGDRARPGRDRLRLYAASRLAIVAGAAGGV